MSTVQDFSQELFDLQIRNLGEMISLGAEASPFKVVLLTAPELGHGVSLVAAKVADYLATRDGSAVSLLRWNSSSHDAEMNVLSVGGRQAKEAAGSSPNKNVRISKFEVPKGTAPKTVIRDKLAEVREHSTYVVLDMPPIMRAPEILEVLPSADMILLIVRSGMMKWQTLKKVNDLIQVSKPKNYAIVLNGKKHYIPSRIYSKL